MFDRNETERDDALQGLFGEIGEGMAPPAALVRAVKGGVYLNPAAKRGTHVWKFAKAVVGYALGVMLFLGAILLLPKLWEDGEPTVGTPSDTTAPADDTKPFGPPAELREEIEAAWLKEYGSPLKWWYEYSSNSGYGVRCYGTYNGCTVLFEKTDLTAVTTKRIAGYAFTCGNSFILCVYRDGEFKNLAEAYDDGWISAEDVGRAAERHEKFTGIDWNEREIQSIIAAYAKQFGKDEEKLSVQIVGRYGIVRAVYVYEEGAYYPDEDTLTHGGRIEDVYGLEFSYLHTPVLLIYRTEDKFYSLSDAAEQGVIAKENVRELYITHNFAALDFKERVYCTATLQDEFFQNQIVIAVYPEFNGYLYTPSDFTDIGCVAVEEVAGDGALSSNGEAARYRLLLLTLNKESKENVLKQIKLLEVERDVYTAVPYGYQKEPGVTPPQPEPVEEEIIEAYAKRYGKDVSKLSVRIVYADTRGSSEYFVVFVDDADVQYENRLIMERVGDCLFCYGTTQPLLLYHNGRFFALADVYEVTGGVSVLDRYNLPRVERQYRSLYPELYDEAYLQTVVGNEIKQLCVEQYGKGSAEDYSVRFVLSYLDAFVVYIDGRYVAKDAVYEQWVAQRVGGLNFVYPDGVAMSVYCGGKLYSLPDALKRGVIRYDTVKSLYSLHESALTEEIIEAHKVGEPCDEAYPHRVEYIAQMGDRYAIFFHCPGVAYTEEEWCQTVNGLEFQYNNGHTMDIYCDGRFYSVPSAFEKGILSENQLRYLYEIYRGNYDYPYAE